MTTRPPIPNPHTDQDFLFELILSEMALTQDVVSACFQALKAVQNKNEPERNRQISNALQSALDIINQRRLMRPI